MPARASSRPGGSLVPLVVVTVAALVFAVLLILVRLQWAPLESADHGAAARLNGLIAGHAAVVAVVKAVMVALSRMYRGEHHPTDILASLLFAGLWLTATTLLIKPNGVTRRPAADRARTVAPDRTDVTARR